jgi:hypothetical protein
VRALESQLRNQLATAASGRGVASVSTLWPGVPEPVTVWTLRM